MVLAVLLLLGALPAAAASPQALAPLHEATGQAIDGQYIVVMKGTNLPEQAADRAGVQVQHVFRHALNGFAAQLNERQLEAIRRNPRVDYVEVDQIATTLDDARATSDAGTQDIGIMNHNVQTNPPWGLDRIDQRNRPLDGLFHYHTTASNVDIYIVDTGIQLNHPQFRRSDGTSRALAGYDAFGGSSNDCNGHGTHVAGTAGGNTYGIAKGAYLWAVRVLNCSGSGSYSGIIAGTDWVRQHAASWGEYPAVANYSLGGGYSSALNSAINNLSNSGVFVAVASGNSGANACNYSPASASTVFSTNASNSSDQRASFSNYGSCTHGYAPGVNIPSAWINSGTRTISGTSMASPHVAGVAALYKANGDASYSTVRNWLINNATTNVISGNPSGTPNRLLFKSTL
jgi:subtilisin family serine protease